MSHRIVDIAHSCGYVELNHPVELGIHVKHHSDVSVEDHLRVKHCVKCATRGTWSYKDSVPVAVVHQVKDAQPKP